MLHRDALVKHRCEDDCARTRDAFDSSCGLSSALFSRGRWVCNRSHEGQRGPPGNWAGSVGWIPEPRADDLSGAPPSLTNDMA